MTDFKDTVSHARGVINALREAGIDEDDEDFAVILEAETDVPEMIRRMLRRARYTKALAEGCKPLIDEIKHRQDRLEKKAKGLQMAAYHMMRHIGTSKIEAPDFTASFRAVPPSVEIEDEGLIPSQLMREKVERAPDKAAIKAALEQGEQVPGARLSEPGQTLSVRGR